MINPCPDCGATTKADCKCPDDNCESCSCQMKTLFMLLAAITIIAVSTDVRSNDTNTQTNTSGSNTNITGGYTTTNNNTYQSGSSNDTYYCWLQYSRQ